MRFTGILTTVVCLFTSISARGLYSQGTNQVTNTKDYAGGRSKRSIGVPSEQCPSAGEKADILKRMKQSQAVQSLIDHSSLFDKPKILEPVPGVYFLIGWGLANSIVIDAPDGLIVIDTMDSVNAAQPAVEALRNLTQRPVAAIIYTHNHPDHISGTSVFVAGQESSSYDIWGYMNIIEEFWGKWLYNRPVLLARSFRQVGVPLNGIGPNAIVNSGLGPRFVADETTGLMLNPPNKFLESDEMKVTIAGLDVELLYIPGETRDQMAILFPDFNGRRMLACGDNYYHMFPNLYAIRGTPPRPVLEWAESVREMRSLKPEVLLPSHTQPIIGADIIYERFTKYMDAIKFVHDQTIRLMNHGLHPDEIAEQVILPEALREEYTLEHYGRVDWSVKSVFEGQLGWFSGYPEELKPLSPKKRGTGLVEAFGADNLIVKGREAFDMGKYQQALEFASYVWHSDLTHDGARKLRQDALIKLAENEVSANGRNYYMTWLLEESCMFDNTLINANDFATLKLVPLDNLLTKMMVMLIADKVVNVTCNLRMTVTDTKPRREWDLELRNSILQVSEVMSTEDYNGPRIYTNSEDLREFLIGKEPLWKLDINVSVWCFADLETFRSYFDGAYLV